MSEGVLYGVLSLLGLQLLSFLGGILIYARQKSALDVEKRDRGVFGPMVKEAAKVAADALAGVERIDVDQYRSLAKKLGEAYAEIEFMKAKIAALEESIRTMNNKLASREKYEKRAERREQAEHDDTLPLPPAGRQASGDMEIPPGVDPLEWFKAKGLAVPLEGQAYQQQQLPLNNQVPGKFGRKAV